MAGIVDVGGWVAPAMELIYEQGTTAFRGQWPRIEPLPELAALRPGRGDWPHPALALRAARSRAAHGDAWSGDPGDPPAPPVPAGVLHDNPAGRVAALDAAGVELQLISPGPSIDACLQLPSNLAAGVFAAYNRYAIAYCRAHPRRLGAVLQLHGSEPRWSAHEVAELRGEASVRAVSICLPAHARPQLDPLWGVLEDSGLPLLQRSSFGARVLGVVLDPHPGLRVAFLPGDSRSFARNDLAVGSHVFAATGGRDLHDRQDATLWASDFPLRGSLADKLASARRALGPRAEEVLVVAPECFLGASRAGRVARGVRTPGLPQIPA